MEGRDEKCIYQEKGSTKLVALSKAGNQKQSKESAR
jgi:hypothetical protein